jgi:glutathione S-transferase
MLLYDLINARKTHFSPNTWRIRMALAHKGIQFDVVDVRFIDIAGIRPKGDSIGHKLTIPTIEHEGMWVTDSWEIAHHLDDAFPDAPRLITPGADESVLRFFQYWVQTTLHSGIFRNIVLDLYLGLDPADQPYFRETREKTLRNTLEQAQAGRSERLDSFRKSLQPMRLSLANVPFICGADPGYADYLAFGAFQWARVSSPFQLLAADDVVLAWFNRCLDLYAGMGRKEPAMVDDLLEDSMR